MEGEEFILIEYNIVKAVSFNGGISGTTTILVDAKNNFVKRALERINFKIITVARETHDVCWRKYLAEVKKSSNVSIPEIILLTKLQGYANNDLFVNVVSLIKSVKPAIWMKEG